MDGKRIADDLLTGSAEIDRMRHAVESVVKMVLGLAQTEIPSESAPEFFWFERRMKVGYAYKDCRWRVGIDQNGRLFTACWKLFSSEGYGERIAYSSIADIPFRLENIQSVYEARGAFIEGMAETFPGLPKRWQPLLDAAVASLGNESTGIAEAAERPWPKRRGIDF